VAAGERDGDPPGTDEEERERAALLAAFRRTAAEQGYRTLTIEAVVRAAGVSRERFDAHFADKEEALLAAQAEFLDRLHGQVAGSCRAAAPPWHEQLRAGLRALLANLAEAEGLARALAVEAAGESFGAAQRQFEALERFAALLHEGRRHLPDAVSLPRRTERVLVGGLASLLTEFLLAEEAAALPGLEPELLEVLLIPYLGVEGARRAASG
jgi:AcrR family transcriptional regulator